MAEEIKRYGIKEYLRRFVMGFQLISSLVLGIFLVIILYFAMIYADSSPYSEEIVVEAQKIGNWEFPDDKYVLKKFENISLDNKNIGAVAVKDKKSGNTLMIFAVGFSQEEILKTKDIVQSKLLEKYSLGESYLKSGGHKTGRIGEEFVYSEIMWNSDGIVETGIIGSMDCLKNKKIGSNIIAVAINSFARYDKGRALEFINTLNCPAGDNEGSGDIEIGDKIDLDNDGLTDKVERMLGSDPYKKDTDGDGYNDFDELQQGYSPMVPRFWDKYTAEELDKVKQDIKYINIDVYDALFPEK